MKIKARHIITIGAIILVGGIGYIQTKPPIVTPPPPPGGNCTMADASGCAVTAAQCAVTFTSGCRGTFLTFTNPTTADIGTPGVSNNSFLVNCNQNILLYAQATSAPGKHQGAVVSSPNGLGGYPVHINTIFTGTYNPNLVGFKGTTGCTGSGNRALTDVPDLVIDTPLVASGGVAVAGFGDDAFKFDTGFGCSGFVRVSDPGLTGACTGITVAGNINTGPLVSPNHQDCIQELGGDNAWFVDIRSGDFQNGIAGCIGDGGALYINAAAPSGGAGCVPQPSGANCQNPWLVC
jgi:hypothetical protein